MTANQGETENSQPQYAGRVPADTFANRLLLARKLAGMTIEDAADAAGLSKSSWANWENGRRPHDQIEVSRAIATALDVDFNWLVFGGPLAGAQGPRVAKRPGSFRVTYAARTLRPTSARPKVREDSARPISAQAGQPRRAVRVNTNRPAEVIHAA